MNRPIYWWGVVCFVAAFLLLLIMPIGKEVSTVQFTVFVATVFILAVCGFLFCVTD